MKEWRHAPLHPMDIFNYLFCVIWFTLLLAAVVDCLRSNNPNKVGWIAVIVLLPLLGPVLYFLYAQGRFISEL